MPYRQPGSKYWWISYPNGHGGRTRRSSKTSDYRKADAEEKQCRADAAKQQAVACTFNSLMETYLTDILGTDRAARVGFAITGLTPFFEGRDMHGLKPVDISRYLRNRGVSVGTMVKELRTFSAAINHVNHEHGWNVPNIVSRRIPADPEGRVRWLTEAEAGKLVKAARESTQAKYLADMILLALNTGMRRGEVLGLEWDRVDFGHRLVYLFPENQKNRRTDSVPLSDAAVAALKRHWGKNDRYVFVYRDNPIKSVRTSFRVAREKAGIAHCTFHDLRHTRAAWLVQAGVPIVHVKELLRHQSVKTTMRYAHLSPDNIRAVVDAANYDGHYDGQVDSGGLQAAKPVKIAG